MLSPDRLPETHAERRRQDRDLLRNFLAISGGASSSLRRDDCGDWRAVGRQSERTTGGWAFACAEEDALYFVVIAPSVRAWTFAKRKLAFCTVTQDGDDEGILRLGRPPTPREGKIIRVVLGIPATRPGGNPKHLMRARAEIGAGELAEIDASARRA
jgi:hypothetical protein